MQMIINPNISEFHFCFPYLKSALQKTAENESVCSYVFKIRDDILQIEEYRSFFSRGRTSGGKTSRKGGIF